ncbi:MAG: carbon monoxide dehydrogenase subunit G [Chloroflexi bacterium]|nr:carbon monoxide dehydrogenase subunit G [Chloroflexota bacterium]
MELSGTYTFNAPRDVVWPALLDPEVLAKVMPGCEKLEQIGENEYQGVIKIKVGPVQGVFQGLVSLSDINAPESYRMAVDGKGAPGFMKGEGEVRLEPQGDATLMHYSGKAQVGGRIASVGQRLLDSSAKALTRQSLDGLDKQIQARLQAAASSTAEASPAATAQDETPAPPPTVEAPTQTEFAIGVTKKMLDEVIPPQQRPLWIGVALVIVAIIAFLIWGR